MKISLTSLKTAMCAVVLLLVFPSIAQDTEHKHIHAINNHSSHNHNHHQCGMDAMTDRLIRNNPDYANALREYKEQIVPAMSRMETDRSVAPIIYVPVVVHVIHNGEPVGTGANLSDERILAQIEVLNLDFSAMNDNYDDTPTQWQDDIGNPEIQFCMAIVDPNGDPTNGITRHNIEVTGTNSNNSNIEDEIKPATWWDSNIYYNIYVVGIPGTTAGGGVTGYAYLPFNGTIGNVVDGSVVDYNWFGGPGFGQSGYSTLTHETGHYLGLPHPFDGEDCGADDGIADTPNIDAPTSDYAPGLNCGSNFPTGPTSCTNEHMYVNFMDYVNDDDCSTSFTNGQINVMRAVMDGTPVPGFPNYGSRLPLANSSATACAFFDDDAGIASIFTPGASVCGDDQVTPVVELQNFGLNDLTTVTIRYQVNGGAPVDFIWIDVLETGATQNVTLNPFTPPAGTYTFTVTTLLPNGTTDEQASNDEQSISVTTITPTNLPLIEGFEDPAFNPTVNGVYAFNTEGDVFEWARSEAASGFGIGTASAVFNNYSSNGGSNPGGTTDALITSVYDFSEVTGAMLSFDVAYAPYDAQFFDSLKVLVSTDCGANFDVELFSDGNTGLATAPATTALFTPSSTQWETHTIDLSQFDNTDNLTISFLNVSGYGNQLFIDNINLSAGCTLEVNSIASQPSCSDVCDGVASVDLVNATMPVTYQWDSNAGNATSAIVNNLCGGTYSVTVTDAANCTAETVVELVQPDPIVLNVTSTDETAPGANDGTATVTANGGTGILTILWSNGETTNTIENLEPGSYNVVVTDENDCVATEGVTIGAATPVCMMELEAVTNDVLCNGSCDGSIDLIINDGTAPYTHEWSNGSNEATLTGICPGEYSVTVTDAENCTAELTSINILEPSALTLSVSTTDETAVNMNDGTATANINGGTLPYTYQWNDPNSQTTQTALDLAPGIYCVTVTDNNGCTIEGCEEVLEYDCGNFVVTTSSEDVLCFGDANGIVTATASNGTEPYTYQWNIGMGMSGQQIEDVEPGTYTVTATDANGCMIEGQTTVGEPTQLVATVTCTDETSPGANDGACFVESSGGVPGYTEQWSNGQGGIEIGPLEPGVYCVTITDSNGCTAESCGTVSGASCDFVIEVSSSDVSCFGSTDGSATVTTFGGTAPFEYNWSSGDTTSTINSLAPGMYMVTVVDVDGCEAFGSVDIGEPDLIQVTLSGTPPSSPGGNDGTVTANPTGGVGNFTYLWANMETTQTINNLTAGVYSVTVTDDNACTAENIIELIDPDPGVDCNDFSVEVDIIEITCNGFQNGALVAMGINGTDPISYSWSNGVNTAVNAGLGAGSYTVTATDNEGCQSTLTIPLIEPSPVVINLTTTPSTTNMSNDGTAAVNPSGGTPDYTYEWSTGATTQSINSLAPGAYVVTVTDMNGCIVVEEFIIGIDGVDCQNFEILEFQVTDVNCFGGFDGSATVITANGAEPIIYSWSNGATGQTIENVSSGIYIVSIVDANGCELISEVEIDQPAAGLFVDFSTTNETSAGACDGTIDATITGGTPVYTIMWSNGAVTEDLDNLCPGDYTIEITDANGCMHTASITIFSDGVDCSNLTLIAEQENVSCNGAEDGLLVVTGTGGTDPYTYEWSTGELSQSLFNLSGGIYTVTITDGLGCQIQETFVVSEAPPIELTLFSSDETGLDLEDGTAAVTAVGGVGGFSYSWSNGAMGASIMNLAPGVYTVTATDTDGCTSIGEVEIIEFVDLCASFEASTTGSDLLCADDTDGTASVQAAGGLPPYQYLWSNGSMAPNQTNISGGIYTVTVEDQNGCVLVLEAQVTEPNPIEINVQGAGGNCGAGGTASASASGGTPAYTYEWDNGMSGNIITDLEDGIYLVTVTDANGCSNVGETVIENSAGGIDAEADIDGVSCFGDTDGSINLTLIEGTGPFEYSWNNGATTQDIFDLEAGTYTVLITDADNCSFLSTYEVTEPAILDASINSTPATSGNNGSATAIVNGGTTPYSFAWSNGSNSSSIQNLFPGNYSVTVTDDNNCTVSASVMIGTTNVDELPALSMLEIAPNPSDGHFWIDAEFTSNQVGQIEVYNVIGQQVFVQGFNERQFSLAIDITNQSAGTYMLVIQTEEGRVVRKLILTR